ncbi:MAG: hypothetical protein FWC41_02610 [Firmicutes bacterium]|nr:hypothetical protein [Bacillota bacterium]
MGFFSYLKKAFWIKKISKDYDSKIMEIFKDAEIRYDIFLNKNRNEAINLIVQELKKKLSTSETKNCTDEDLVDSLVECAKSYKKEKDIEKFNTDSEIKFLCTCLANIKIEIRLMFILSIPEKQKPYFVRIINFLQSNNVISKKNAIVSCERLISTVKDLQTLNEIEKIDIIKSNIDKISELYSSNNFKYILGLASDLNKFTGVGSQDVDQFTEITYKIGRYFNKNYPKCKELEDIQVLRIQKFVSKELIEELFQKLNTIKKQKTIDIITREKIEDLYGLLNLINVKVCKSHYDFTQEIARLSKIVAEKELLFKETIENSYHCSKLLLDRNINLVTDSKISDIDFNSKINISTSGHFGYVINFFEYNEFTKIYDYLDDFKEIKYQCSMIVENFNEYIKKSEKKTLEKKTLEIKNKIEFFLKKFESISKLLNILKSDKAFKYEKHFFNRESIEAINTELNKFLKTTLNDKNLILKLRNNFGKSKHAEIKSKISDSIKDQTILLRESHAFLNISEVRSTTLKKLSNKIKEIFNNVIIQVENKIFSKVLSEQ